MADQYASIIIDISHEDVDRVFQYRIPPALLPEIRVGVQVCVPFGSGNRTRTGYVVELTDRPDYDKEKIKELIPGGKAQGDFRRPEGGGVGSVPAH